jgi:hypothetical protein
MKTKKDEELSGKFAKGLKDAIHKRRTNPEKAAQLLKVEVGTMYKYLAGDIIPGGQVIWLACLHLGMVLDADGFRPVRKTARGITDDTSEDTQEAFPFINELIEGDKIRAQVRKKDNQFVQVNLRIKVAG